MFKYLIIFYICLLTACSTIPTIHQVKLKVYAESIHSISTNSIADINTYVNTKPYHATAEWTAPTDFIKYGGDCKGYVITKRALILANNLAKSDDMLFTLVQVRATGAYHAILSVQGMSLDNRTANIYAVNSEWFSAEYAILAYEIE
jgi:predicted transglutaminase-like cysteine proteinase